MIPRWSQNIVTLLSVGAIHEQPIRTIKQSCLYTLLVGRLYKARSDCILTLCIDPKEREIHLNQTHVAMGNIHFSKDQTLRRLQYFGVYWPKMRLDVHNLVQACAKCCVHPPLPYATRFQVQVNPKWGQHIVGYLQKKKLQKT